MNNTQNSRTEGIITTLNARKRAYAKRAESIRAQMCHEKDEHKKQMLRVNRIYLIGRAAEAQGMIYVLRGVLRDQALNKPADMLAFTRKKG